jgi:hypothetical protein
VIGYTDLPRLAVAPRCGFTTLMLIWVPPRSALPCDRTRRLARLSLTSGHCHSTDEGRRFNSERTSTDPGTVHHIAFLLSNATFRQTVERLDERGIEHSGVKDRGFMDSIYFEDPLGLLIELAAYRFEPPSVFTHAEVLLAAHRIRVERGDYNIDSIHLADAIEQLVASSRASLSADRAPKNPYARSSEVEDPNV